MGSSATEAELHGFSDPRFNGKVVHFRGIPYATVSKRFARPVLATNWRENGTNFTKYGPLCPQPRLAYELMFGLPEDTNKSHDGMQADVVEFDEFRCCNLNITCPVSPATSGTREAMPVYVWIHGGGQAASFPAAGERLGDPGPLVAQSIEMNKPIVLVTFNYRLNIFGFAHPEGVDVNLGMEDQKMALQWVRGYIHLFNGDAENITLGGQSAGATYTHGLLAMGVKVRRAILASGSLYLSPPSARARCLSIHRWMEEKLALNHSQTPAGTINSAPKSAHHMNTKSSLYTAPASEMMQILSAAGFYSWWMFDDRSTMGDWKDDSRVFDNVAVLLSDCKEEGAHYDPRLRLIPKQNQQKIFRTILSAPQYTALSQIYNFDNMFHDDHKWAQTMREFVNDARYALWTQEIWRNIIDDQDPKLGSNGSGKEAYLYRYDLPNPLRNWADWGYPVAHHAVDLLAAFGGFDEYMAQQVAASKTGSIESSRVSAMATTLQAGQLMRGFWIRFINGEDPWEGPDAEHMVYAFGADGKNGVTSAAEDLDILGSRGKEPRRRQAQLQVLKEIGFDKLTQVWQALLPTEGVD